MQHSPPRSPRFRCGVRHVKRFRLSAIAPTRRLWKHVTCPPRKFGIGDLFDLGPVAVASWKGKHPSIFARRPEAVERFCEKMPQEQYAKEDIRPSCVNDIVFALAHSTVVFAASFVPEENRAHFAAKVQSRAAGQAWARPRLVRWDLRALGRGDSGVVHGVCNLRGLEARLSRMGLQTIARAPHAHAQVPTLVHSLSCPMRRACAAFTTQSTRSLGLRPAFAASALAHLPATLAIDASPCTCRAAVLQCCSAAVLRCWRN